MVIAKSQGFIQKCILFGLLSAVLFSVLFTVYSASAESQWDNSLSFTDELIVQSESQRTCEPQDITTQVGGILSAPLDNTPDYWVYSNAQSQPFRDAWIQSQETGSWAILQFTSKSNQNDKFVRIYYSKQPLSLDWDTDGTVRVIGEPGNAVYMVDIINAGQIYSNSRCDLVIASMSYSQTWRVFNNAPYDDISVFLSTFIPDYPAGYDGEEIPDTITPSVQSDFTPKWNAVKYENFKVTFSDQNFFTIDKNPFTCGEEGFAPIIEYQIVRDDTQELIDEGQFFASSHLEYQFEKVPERRDYTITGNYTQCEGVSFTDDSSFTFMFNEAGGQHIQSFHELCTQDTFPFLDFENCLWAIEQFINTLSFGSIKFSDNWTHQPNCYQMQVLDEWLHLEQSELCPQFPENIRNTTTPFVTFALGLLTILFISSRKDKYA